MADCIIHEFSTGIEPDKTSDGDWYSRGFTGKWMNSTLDRVPDAVERAIKNSEFDTKGYSRNNPAIIGRVVRGHNDDWSVVAVATLGKDESRSFTAFRYFLCEGKDNLCIIVGWLSDREKNKTIPTFDPFYKTEPIEIYRETIRNYRHDSERISNQLNNKEFIDWLERNSPPPITVTPKKYALLAIDRIATKIARDNNSLVSWSYNVEALERPDLFLVIQPASHEAYSRMSTGARISRLPVLRTNEPDFELAIQSLMKSENLYNNLRIINDTLERLEKHDRLKEELNNIFEELSVIASNSPVELLTLKALVLPETLATEYLSYIHLDFDEKFPLNLLNQPPLDLLFQQQNIIRKKSLDFQSKLRKTLEEVDRKSLTQLYLKLRQGFSIVIEEFFKKPVSNNISSRTLIWLANAPESLWQLGCDEGLVKKVSNDLSNLYIKYQPRKKGESIHTEIKIEMRIWDDLIKGYWHYFKDKKDFKPISNSKYKTLAIIFSNKKLVNSLLANKLAAFFYKVSTGNIPQEILERLPYEEVYQVFGINLLPKSIEIIGKTSQIELLLNLFLYSFCLLVGIKILGNLWQRVVFTLVATVLVSVYLVGEQKQSRIIYFFKNISLSLIMFAFILGNFIVNDSPNVVRTPPQVSSTPVSRDITEFQIVQAVETFTQPNKTRDAIEKITANLIKDDELYRNGFQVQRRDIISAFKDVMGLPRSFSYAEILKYIEQNPKSKKEKIQNLKPLVTSIYKYQASKKIKADGVIDLIDKPDKNPKSTMQVLQEDIKTKLMNNENNTNE